MARAATPLPVPDSPVSSTVVSGARATSAMRRSASLIDADSPSRPENFAASSATTAAVVSLSTRARAIFSASTTRSTIAGSSVDLVT